MEIFQRPAIEKYISSSIIKNLADVSVFWKAIVLYLAVND